MTKSGISLHRGVLSYLQIVKVWIFSILVLSKSEIKIQNEDMAIWVLAFWALFSH